MIQTETRFQFLNALCKHLGIVLSFERHVGWSFPTLIISVRSKLRGEAIESRDKWNPLWNTLTDACTIISSEDETDEELAEETIEYWLESRFLGCQLRIDDRIVDVPTGDSSSEVIMKLIAAGIDASS